jgi:tetratricopeptide (TPR) repeat protein
LGLLERLLVAARSVTFYLWKFAWPVWLSPYYPLGSGLNLWQAEFIVPAVVVLLVSVASLLLWGRVPLLLASWVAYLALLAPVSGLVQVGPQAVADRFMYLAIIPVLLMVAGGLIVCWRNSRSVGRGALLALALLLLGFQMRQTTRQLPAWRDDETMWRTVLQHYPQSGIANFHLAAALVERRRFEEALPHARYSVAIIPENPLAQSTLGMIYVRLRRPNDALPALQRSLTLDPRLRAARFNLACAYAALHRTNDACSQLEVLLTDFPPATPTVQREPILQPVLADPDCQQRLHRFLPNRPGGSR